MSKMTSASTRHYGRVFDEIATDYNRHRPGYPVELVDYACKIAGLKSGDNVLELGCGSGQLTRDLVDRGFNVTALEPGMQLIALAEQNVKELGAAEFVNEKFEDAKLPKTYYKAVFSASAFHWIDPDISWQKVAKLLIPGGVLALISYFGLSEQRTSGDLELLLAALKKVSPEIAASWPHYHKLDEIIDGVKTRQENISDAWAWLGDYDLGRKYVSNLFSDTEVAVVPHLVEQTADELIALFRTISSYSRLSTQQQNDIEYEYREIYKNIGRPIRSSSAAVLVTARLS